MLKTMRGRARLALSFILFSGSGLTAAAQTSRGHPDHISVDVNLVVLQATVTDRKAEPVAGLQEKDFQVYDDGVLQPITLFRHEDVPVTVGLVVDHSGSMGPKISDVIAAAETFARASNPADQLFVVNFNENVTFGLAEFTSNVTALQKAVAAMRTTGKTALYDAVAAGLRQIREGTRARKVLIVISDGGDNTSQTTEAEVMKLAKQSNAVIYTIGLFDEDDPDRNPKVLERLARATGGEVFLPQNPKAVIQICDQIAKDIRSQYTLGFAPPTTDGGVWRTIRVVAKAPHGGKLQVRTRSGYYLASPEPQSATEDR